MLRSRTALVLALALVPFGCTDPPKPPPFSGERASASAPAAIPPPPEIKFDVGAPVLTARPPPEGFVSLSELDPSIRLEIRYATTANFTGHPLPGYMAKTAWLTSAAAEALVRVQQDLAAEGLGLLVYDAYRPKRATEAMVTWAEKSGRTALLDDGYVARDSNHNRGNTVDLTLVSLETGLPLPMGTEWDAFTKDSHYGAATGEAKANRKRLRTAMTAHGFAPYDKEWWHFTLPSDPEPPVLDVSYSP